MTETKEPYETTVTLLPEAVPSPEGPTSPEAPTFLLISLPRGWSPGGTVQGAYLVIVRDGVPGQGIAVDTLPVNLDVKAGSLSTIKEWLECL